MRREFEMPAGEMFDSQYANLTSVASQRASYRGRVEDVHAEHGLHSAIPGETRKAIQIGRGAAPKDASEADEVAASSLPEGPRQPASHTTHSTPA